MSDALRRLNAMPPSEAEAALRRCFDSSAWVRDMVAARPFGDRAELLELADRAWEGLGPGDWREAMEGHPRLGGDDLEREQFADTRAWSAREQAGVTHAAGDVRDALAEAQAAYEQRFGHVFLIAAAGLDARQILEALRERMSNEPERELEIAAGELKKIARSRFDQILEEEGGEGP